MKLVAVLSQLFLCTTCYTNVTIDPSHAQSLEVGKYERISVQPGPNYTFAIHLSMENYSGFSFQLHTHEARIFLYNGSVDCLSELECVTTGSSVGMVQLLTHGVSSYEFKANLECVREDCRTNITLLAAVVGFGINDPVPGGCAQTSNLENDAVLSAVLAPHSKLLSFQASDIGFNPTKSGSPMLCDYNESSVIDRLEYQVYRKCLPSYDFSSDTFFEAIEEMLFPGKVGKLQTVLTGKDVKRILFDSTPSAGEVYNVIAVDTKLLTTSFYIPVVAYGCQLDVKKDCMLSIPVVNVISGIVVGLVGLFLCFLAHRLFHIEVFIFTSLIMSYLFYMLLNAFTDWPYTALAGGSIGLGVVLSILLYSFWFFFGWYYLFVILFGLASDFILTATILFSPVGTMVSIFAINYVYALVLLCGCIVFMVPLVAFPRALNILSSSLVGSYAIIFGVGTFKRTILTDIVLRVMENASVSGFLSSPSSCQLELFDVILSAIWGLVFLLSVVTQSLLAWQHKTAFKKCQEGQDMSIVTSQTPYKPFPGSPFKQLKAYLSKTNKDTRPLLSPYNARWYGTID